MMPQAPGFRRMRPLQFCLVLSATSLVTYSQDAQGLGYTQSLKAEVVLTPAFCKTSIKKGSFLSSQNAPFGKEPFAVGPAACRQIEQALKYVFSNLTRVDRDPAPGTTSAQVILVPKFVDISVTWPAGPLPPAFSERELVVLLEWTAKNAAGKPVWVETVQGSAKRPVGIFFGTGERKRIIEDAVKNLLETSTRKMSDATELRNLAR
jgi:hypothetical protein